MGKPDLIVQRREEIINACETLYQSMNFKDITLKDIGNITDFSRPTIYNYFHSKEEIFLALFKREYERWNEDLETIVNNNTRLSKVELAHVLALSLDGRIQLLRLLSMNNYDMEANSREELLRDFKVSYGKTMKSVRRILNKFCPEMGAEEINQFIYIFFPFMLGIYPYTVVTDKQRIAMTDAKIDYKYQSVYEITNNCILRLLGKD